MEEEKILVEKKATTIEQGMTYTFTGASKGKTTSSFGLIMRALGSSKNILLVQFLKGDENAQEMYGEVKTCQLFKNQLHIIQTGKKKIVMEHNKNEDDARRAVETFKQMEEALQEGKLKKDGEAQPYNLLVMDEILPAINLGLITQKRFFRFHKKLRTTSPEVDIVLTGRVWNEEFMSRITSISDLVTECRSIKHPFNKTCKKCDHEYYWRYNYCPVCASKLVSVPAKKGLEY